MYGALKRALFKLEPERSHHMVNRLLAPAQNDGLVRRIIQARPADPRLSSTVFGLDFAHPLGMAAGFDKEAAIYNGLLALGLSHVEVGTVTPLAQPGNPKPRIQRFLAHQALVNRMGFPGPGMDAIHARLAKHPPIGPLGINIGPNKETPADKVADSLFRLSEHLASKADYLAINVSSPNTPGLRDLQTPEAVARLITRTLEGADGAGHNVPVLLKVHPDSPADELLTVARAAVDAGAAGIIATNTTKERLPGMDDAMEGGMSGAPLLDRSVALVGALHHGLGRDTPIVGVGGIRSGADAFRHIQAGASLVQTYTGFIYGGPKMPVLAQKGLIQCLDDAGFDHLAEAVGTA